MDRALEILNRFWGYPSFRPLQERSMRCVLDGHDSLTVLPTGGGKSICYQVPALCHEGLAIVVSPLISLMKDQVDALRQNGVTAACINSTLGASEKLEVARQIGDGELRLLYLAPEKLLSRPTLGFLKQQAIAFVAFDEAHCVSQWGHDFRPEYRGLGVLREEFPDASLHAFTATASAQVREDIIAQLRLRDARCIVGDFDRPNLTYRMMRADRKHQQILEVIRRHPGESGIVYCISRKEVERTADALRGQGCRAVAYHAGMSDEQRRANQDAFMKEECDVVVATIAFGMGIDKSNVRFVIHVGMPKSVEHYQQESGRAGRDGLDAECVLLYSPRDLTTWKTIMGEQASPGQHEALDAMFRLCSGPGCRHHSIVQYFGGEYFGGEYAKPNCHACDVCLDEIKWIDDPVTTSQKILSCVVRLQERYGAAHTAKVLAGSKEERIQRLKHDHLSTFGLLSQQDAKAIREWIDQLISQGFLSQQGEYNVLKLTPQGRRLLRGEGKPQLRAIQRGDSRVRPEEAWKGVDRKLFDRLREFRSELASQRDVPAYTIFGDGTLRQFARVRSSELAGIGKIPGVGMQKFEAFGKPFFDVLDEHCIAHDLSRDQDAAISGLVPASNSYAAFDYFRQGESIDDVAQKLTRAKSTVVGYLTDYLRTHHISDPTPWVSPAIVEKILANRHLVAEGRIKPLFDHFGGEVSYEEIKITLACDG